MNVIGIVASQFKVRLEVFKHRFAAREVQRGVKGTGAWQCSENKGKVDVVRATDLVFSPTVSSWSCSSGCDTQPVEAVKIFKNPHSNLNN